MEKEDKIAFGVILAILCGIGFGILKVIHWIGTSLFGAFKASADGVGYTDAFLTSVGVSTALIILFALISGGGDLLGELPFVLIGYFILIAFFTFSIAFVF